MRATCSCGTIYTHTDRWLPVQCPLCLILAIEAIDDDWYAGSDRVTFTQMELFFVVARNDRYDILTQLQLSRRITHCSPIYKGSFENCLKYVKKKSHE